MGQFLKAFSAYGIASRLSFFLTESQDLGSILGAAFFLEWFIRQFFTSGVASNLELVAGIRIPALIRIDAGLLVTDGFLLVPKILAVVGILFVLLELSLSHFDEAIADIPLGGSGWLLSAVLFHEGDPLPLTSEHALGVGLAISSLLPTI